MAIPFFIFWLYAVLNNAVQYMKAGTVGLSYIQSLYPA